jgi:hypothetical protein
MMASAGVPDLVYSEGLLKPIIVESADDIARYGDLWDALQGVALDPYASRNRVKQYLDESTRTSPHGGRESM